MNAENMKLYGELAAEIGSMKSDLKNKDEELEVLRAKLSKRDIDVQQAYRDGFKDGLSNK